MLTSLPTADTVRIVPDEQVEGTVCHGADQMMPGSVAPTKTTFDPAGGVGRGTTESEASRVGVDQLYRFSSLTGCPECW
jgi:hypothetical protein